MKSRLPMLHGLLHGLLPGLTLAALLAFGAGSAVAGEETIPTETVVERLDSGAGLDAQPGLGAVQDRTQPAHELAGAPATGHGEEHAAGEHGAEHGEGEHAAFSGKTFALQLVNFGVLLFILIYFGGKAMNKSLRARHEQLKAAIDDATRARDEAKQKVDTQARRVAELEKEVAALRGSMQQDSEREQARLIEAAQEKAKRIQEEMRFQIDQQVKAAEASLRAEVASASVKLAEELVKKSVNPDDERRLAQEFVSGFAGDSTGEVR